MADITKIVILDTQSPAVERADLRAAVSGLRVETCMPGGCHICTFRVYAPITFVPTWVGLGYEVRLYDTLGIFWAGRMTEAMAHRSGGADWWDITAYGFGVNLDDQLYTSQDVNGLGTSAIFSAMITALTQQIDVTTTSGATSHTLSAAAAVLLKMLPAKIIAGWLSKFSADLIWYVYPQDDGDIEATLKDRPTTADLYIGLDDIEDYEGGLMGQSYANRVIVEYNAGAAADTVNDSAAQGAGPTGVGYIRAAYLYLPEVSQSVDATKAANALLSMSSTPRMASHAMELAPGARIIDSNGQRVDPWRVRSGQLLQVAGLVTETAALGELSWNNSCLLVHTSYDEEHDQLSLVPEGHDMSLDNIVALAASLLKGRHTTARSAS